MGRRALPAVRGGGRAPCARERSALTIQREPEGIASPLRAWTKPPPPCATPRPAREPLARVDEAVPVDVVDVAPGAGADEARRHDRLLLVAAVGEGGARHQASRARAGPRAGPGTGPRVGIRSLAGAGLLHHEPLGEAPRADAPLPVLPALRLRPARSAHQHPDRPGPLRGATARLARIGGHEPSVRRRRHWMSSERHGCVRARRGRPAFQAKP